MRHLLFRFLVVAVIFGSLTVNCIAQTAGTGAISGTVTDPGGAVVLGADISVINVTTGETRKAVSSDHGTYLIPLLKPATYRVEASKSGFRLSVSAEIPVHITETATVNLQLAVGTREEKVTVTANSELLKTQDASLGQVVDQKQMVALPLVTRNYEQILALSPGTSAEAFNAGQVGRGNLSNVSGGSISSGGSATDDNNVQLNGVGANDALGMGMYSGGTAVPNPDSIQEFKVQTTQFDASSGRNSGASINVMTKGGSNDFHGNLWEYFRNDVLNANTWLRNYTGQPRAVLKQNQFGGTLGGPIKKDKLLFFTSYQGTRQRNGLDPICSSSAYLPLLTNDRSDAALAASVDSTTAFGGHDLLGRPVTASNISAQAHTLFNFKLPNGQYLIPNPQKIIAVNGKPEGFSTFSVPCPYNEDQFITNLDWMQSPKSTFQVRFFFANSDISRTLSSTGSLPGSPAATTQNFRNFSLTNTYLFNNELVNMAVLGFHRIFSGSDQTYPVTWSQLGSTVTPNDNNAVIAVLNQMQVGGTSNTVNASNVYELGDTLSWTHGRHTVRFGGGATYTQINDSRLAFGGIAYFLNYPGLMLGQAPFNPYITLETLGIRQRNWRSRNYNLYVHDDIRLTSRLTVNLGFRFERLGGLGEINGRNGTIDPALVNPNPPSGGSVAGYLVSSNFPGTLPTGVTSTGNNLGIDGDGRNTINPRIGFAWSLPGTDRLVLRGGYGTYHQDLSGEVIMQEITAPPFGMLRQVSPVLTGSFSNPFPADPGAFPQFIPYSPSTTMSITAISRSLQPPVVQKYGLSLQAQLAKDFVLEVGYVGSRSTHLLTRKSINEAALASVSNPIRGVTTNTAANVQTRVPYQGFSASNMQEVASNGVGWYNGLQASLNKRFSHGLQFLASYTFARNLTNSNPAYVLGGTQVGNSSDPLSNYGPDPFTRPHRFVLSAMYELPGPKNLHSLAGEVLGGWRLAGVSTFQTGHRMSLVSTVFNNVYGASTDFLNLKPGCNVNASGPMATRVFGWFNTSCQVPFPVVGSDGSVGWGNSKPGVATGPGQAVTDLSVSKLFPVKWPNEKTNIEFRMEAFNVFNHPIFSDPVNDYAYAATTFGHISTMAVNPRVVQFALKLNF